MNNEEKILFIKDFKNRLWLISWIK